LFFRYFCLALIFLSVSHLHAADDIAPIASEDPRLTNYEGRPRVHAVRMGVEDKISLDGRLDESIWQKAIPATTFTQQDPHNGDPPTENTEVRFVYYALYSLWLYV
jgi:hypothetical protein